MTFSDIAKRLLEYPAIAVADAPSFTPTSPNNSIKDAIFGALGEVYAEAPQQFRTYYPAQLAAPRTGTATPENENLTYAGVGIGLLNTVRIPGNGYDSTVIFRDDDAYIVTPPSKSTLGSDLTITIFNDAVALPSTYDGVGNTVRLNNRLLTKVGSRDDAERRISTGGRENPEGEPMLWWEDKHKGIAYVRVWPMPDAEYALSISVRYAAAAVADNAIYTSTETFDLEAEIMRDIVLPLAVERFQASPLFANPRSREQIEKSAMLARQKLAALTPGREADPPFGSRKRWRGRTDDYGMRTLP